MRLIGVLTLMAIISVTKSKRKLRCGNDDIQHDIAKALLRKDCKGRLDKMDACCVAHTSCYNQRTPQKECDDAFCICVEEAASKMPTCKFHANNFCATARTFGGLQYNRPRSKQ